MKIDLQDITFKAFGKKFKIRSIKEESSINPYSHMPEDYFIATFKLIDEEGGDEEKKDR